MPDYSRLSNLDIDRSQPRRRIPQHKTISKMPDGNVYDRTGNDDIEGSKPSIVKFKTKR